jgi:hypothetical protein
MSSNEGTGGDGMMVVDEMFHEVSTGFRVAGDGSPVEPTAAPPTMEPIVLGQGLRR